MPRSTTLTYPKTPVNKVNRYNVRENYDLSTIHSIINSSSVLHITLPPPGGDNPFPICLPMVGVAASYEHPSAGLGEPLDVYVHGYVSARMMNMSRKGEGLNGGETGEAEGEKKGLPVTVSATKVDGLVLSLTPYTHDINYRSATLYGYATVVADPAEKLWAMHAITNGVVSSRWEHTRVPPTSAELSSTAILKISVVGGSGKIRVGGPRDESKDVDSKDEVLREDEGGAGVVEEGGNTYGGADGKLWREKIWTGVVPVWEALGDPVQGGVGVAGDSVPEHISRYVQETKKANEDYVLQAIKDQSQD